MDTLGMAGPNTGPINPDHVAGVLLHISTVMNNVIGPTLVPAVIKSTNYNEGSDQKKYTPATKCSRSVSKFDDIYKTTYQIAHCSNIKPLPVRLAPKVANDRAQGQSNVMDRSSFRFQVPCHDTPSSIPISHTFSNSVSCGNALGTQSGADRLSSRPASAFHPDMLFSYPGSRASDFFVDSLRPQIVKQQNSTELLLKRLMSYKDNKNFTKSSYHTKSMKSLRESRNKPKEESFKTDQSQPTSLRKPSPRENKLNHTYLKTKRKRFKRNARVGVKDKLLIAYDYLKASKVHVSDVRYLLDLRDSVRNFVQQFSGKNTYVLCPNLKERYDRHRKSCHNGKECCASGLPNAASADRSCQKRNQSVPSCKKKFNPDTIMITIEEWLGDVYKDSAEFDKSKMVDDLARLLADAKNDDDTKDIVQNYVNTLPMWHRKARCELDEFKSKIVNDLLNKISVNESRNEMQQDTQKEKSDSRRSIDSSIHKTEEETNLDKSFRNDKRSARSSIDSIARKGPVGKDYLEKKADVFIKKLADMKSNPVSSRKTWAPIKEEQEQYTFTSRLRSFDDEQVETPSNLPAIITPDKVENLKEYADGLVNDVIDEFGSSSANESTIKDSIKTTLLDHVLRGDSKNKTQRLIDNIFKGNVPDEVINDVIEKFEGFATKMSMSPDAQKLSADRRSKVSPFDNQKNFNRKVAGSARNRRPATLAPRGPNADKAVSIKRPTTKQINEQNKSFNRHFFKDPDRESLLEPSSIQPENMTPEKVQNLTEYADKLVGDVVDKFDFSPADENTIKDNLKKTFTDHVLRGDSKKKTKAVLNNIFKGNIPDEVIEDLIEELDGFAIKKHMPPDTQKNKADNRIKNLPFNDTRSFSSGMANGPRRRGPATSTPSRPNANKAGVTVRPFSKQMKPNESFNRSFFKDSEEGPLFEPPRVLPESIAPEKNDNLKKYVDSIASDLVGNLDFSPADKIATRDNIGKVLLDYLSNGETKEKTKALINRILQDDVPDDVTDDLIDNLNGFADQMILGKRNRDTQNTFPDDRSTTSPINDTRSFYKEIADSPRGDKPVTSTPPGFNADYVDVLKRPYSDQIGEHKRSYVNKVREKVSDWIEELPFDLSRVGDKKFIKAMKDDIAEDVLDRKKYFQLNTEAKKTDAEDVEHIKYQVFRWLSKLLNENDLDHVMRDIDNLSDRIKGIPIPKLVPSVDLNVTRTLEENKTKFNELQPERRYQEKRPLSVDASESVELSDLIRASFDIVKDDLVDAFIDLNYPTDDSKFREQYKTKINDILNKFCFKYLKQSEGGAVKTTEELGKDLFEALRRVSTPEEAADKLAELGDKINQWLKNANINTNHDHLQNYMIPRLAKQLKKFQKNVEDMPESTENLLADILDVTQDFIKKLPTENVPSRIASVMTKQLLGNTVNFKIDDMPDNGAILSPEDIDHLQRIRARQPATRNVSIDPLPLETGSQTDVQIPFGQTAPNVVADKYYWDSAENLREIPESVYPRNGLQDNGNIRRVPSPFPKSTQNQYEPLTNRGRQLPISKSQYGGKPSQEFPHRFNPPISNEVNDIEDLRNNGNIGRVPLPYPQSTQNQIEPLTNRGRQMPIPRSRYGGKSYQEFPHRFHPPVSNEVGDTDDPRDIGNIRRVPSPFLKSTQNIPLTNRGRQMPISRSPYSGKPSQEFPRRFNRNEVNDISDLRDHGNIRRVLSPFSKLTENQYEPLTNRGMQLPISKSQYGGKPSLEFPHRFNPPISNEVNDIEDLRNNGNIGRVPSPYTQSTQNQIEPLTNRGRQMPIPRSKYGGKPYQDFPHQFHPPVSNEVGDTDDPRDIGNIRKVQSPYPKSIQNQNEPFTNRDRPMPISPSQYSGKPRQEFPHRFNLDDVYDLRDSENIHRIPTPPPQSTRDQNDPLINRDEQLPISQSQYGEQYGKPGEEFYHRHELSPISNENYDFDDLQRNIHRAPFLRPQSTQDREIPSSQNQNGENPSDEFSRQLDSPAPNDDNNDETNIEDNAEIPYTTTPMRPGIASRRQILMSEPCCNRRRLLRSMCQNRSSSEREPCCPCPNQTTDGRFVCGPKRSFTTTISRRKPLCLPRSKLQDSPCRMMPSSCSKTPSPRLKLASPCRKSHSPCSNPTPPSRKPTPPCRKPTPSCRKPPSPCGKPPSPCGKPHSCNRCGQCCPHPSPLYFTQ